MSRSRTPTARRPTLAPAAARHLEIRIGVSTRPARVAPGAVAPIPETLIVERWRRLGKTHANGSTYHGCRLKPSLWRLVAAALARRPDLLSLSVEEVAALLPTIRDEARAAGQHLGAISPQVLLTLLRFLARGDRLARILEAHRQHARHGVADLLLYRERKGCAIDFHFVEVKKPTERVSADQVEEIEMLRGLGLKAGIVRLEPRRSEPAAPSARTKGRSRSARSTAVAAAPADCVPDEDDGDNDDDLTPEESELIDQAVDEACPAHDSVERNTCPYARTRRGARNSSWEDALSTSCVRRGASVRAQFTPHPGRHFMEQVIHAPLRS